MLTKQRLNVMLFGNDPESCGGAEEHMITLARELRRDCFRVVLACPPVVLEKLGTNLPSDVLIEPVEFYGPTDFNRARQFASLVRRYRVDILHSHMFHASLVASPLGRLCGVPVIIETPHVRESWRRGWKRSYFIDRMIARTVDAYIAVSEANANYLREQKKLPPSKIRTIRNGIDTERFHPLLKDRELANALGLAQFNSVITVVARLEAQKGHKIVLDAFSDVHEQFPLACLVMVGDGSLRNQLERQAESLGLGRSVIFVGFQTNVAQWLAVSDFTVLPSFYEGLPLAAIESLAAARTVIASAVDGTPEVVVDGQTGLLVAPGDARALAGAMSRLLRDLEWARKLGRTGRKWIIDHFSMERQIRETEDFYLEAYAVKHQHDFAVAA